MPESVVGGELEFTNERQDEVFVYNIMPVQETLGTSYDYLTKFRGFEEEVYYMLECATRENADPEDVVKLCQHVVDERNQALLEKWGKRTNPYELEVPEEKIDYTINDDFSSASIPEQ